MRYVTQISMVIQCQTSRFDASTKRAYGQLYTGSVEGENAKRFDHYV